MTPVSPKCLKCVNYFFGIRKPSCRAFPKGIPKEIFYKGKSHEEPYYKDGERKDRGIVFSEKKLNEEETKDFYNLYLNIK